jgi:Cdc6-like AAA superfamily ATPase
MERAGGVRDRLAAVANAPRFQGTATDQLFSSRGGPVEKARLRLRDAFTPSQPVADLNHFAGREEVLSTLIRSIEDQRLHIVLYGERGIGKTSMLHVLSQLARDAKYIVSYTSCGETSDFSDTFRGIAAQIPLLFHSGYEPTGSESESGATLASQLQDGPISAHQVSELFTKLSGTRVIVILDEFDRSPTGSFRRSVAELIKNLSDRSIRVQLVIAGVAGNLAELVEHIPSIRRNIFGLQLPTMDAGEILKMIRIGETQSGLAFGEQAIELITLVAYGSPHIASLLSQHAGMAALERDVMSVERTDVVTAIHRVSDEVAQRVSERSLRDIGRATQAGHGEGLNLLARAALGNAGNLDTADVPAPFESGEDLERLIRDVGMAYDLVGPIGHGLEGRYRFLEEGVPVHLWLTAVRAGLD